LNVEVPGKPALYQPIALPGWEAIGVVSTTEQTGALVRNRNTGIYCQANAGALRSLPQHKVVAALAGRTADD
jgi:hypothetical protein